MIPKSPDPRSRGLQPSRSTRSSPEAGGTKEEANESGSWRFVGTPVRRVEDSRLLRGHGRYVDDIPAADAMEVAFVRSSEASAQIRAVDSSLAEAVPDVRFVLTADRLPPWLNALHGDFSHPTWQGTPLFPLARGVVRYVGEPIAAVVAEDRYIAEDAAELVVVTYSPLPVVKDMDDALLGDIPPMHPGWKTNVFVHHGLASGSVDDAFEEAYGNLRLQLVNHRQAAVPLEGRVCLARWEGDRLTFWSSTQGPQFVRVGLARLLGIDESAVRVISPDVGGGFGPKQQMVPEELAVALLSVLLETPVKWVEDRAENLLSSLHSREQRHDVEVAYDEQGRVLGLRAEIFVDCGAYSAYPSSAALDGEIAMYALPGPYDIHNIEIQVYSVATNKCPVGPYRGVGRPAACFSIERVMDAVACALELDTLEVRRRNTIRPGSFPYTTSTGSIYDSASFSECLERLAELADYAALRAVPPTPIRANTRIGVGIACMMEQTSFVSAQRFLERGIPLNFDHERTTVRVDPSGRVVVTVPTHSHGQGHETMVAQIVADELKVDVPDIDVAYGDTDIAPLGLGTFNSRSAVVAGGGTLQAATEVRGRLLEVAELMLEADPSDLSLTSNGVCVQGTDRQGISIFDIARWQAEQGPVNSSASRTLKGTIEGSSQFFGLEGTGTVSNAAHLAVVEVDLDTGEVDILRYVVVEDCGRIINPMLVEGQVHGGVAQGVGGCLLEEIVYDDSAQPLTTTLADYLLPTAFEVPNIEVHHLETPSPLTLNGAKGMGESGAIVAAPVLVAAIEDALKGLGLDPIREIPMTPERIHTLLARKPSRSARPQATRTGGPQTPE